MILSLSVLVTLTLLAGCDQNVAPPGVVQRAEPPAKAAPAHTAPAKTGDQAAANPASEPPGQAKSSGDSAAGVTWTRPARWASEGARPMRAATYRVPAAKGDVEDGECAVFYFGPGQGGTVEANLKRWIGQFEQPSGKSSEEVAKTARQTINGLSITTVDLSGTYLASAGPMSPAKEKKPGFRLLGAIVEAPQGNLFFKFTGPAKTIAANADGFQAMLKSLRRQ